MRGSGEVRFERDEHGGVSVIVDEQPQSYVDLDDPEALVFEYIQHFAATIDALLPARPHPRIAITHVGGAGLTLPRWVQHTRPGSPQIVLEPDATLTERVRAELPLPRGHRIRVRGVDGRAGVAALKGESAQVVVIDPFANGSVPRDLVTAEWFTDVVRVVRPGGLVMMNCPDEPGMRYLGRVAAGLRSAVEGGHAPGGDVALIATHEVLKGRRYGNTVLIARVGGSLDCDEIRRQAGRWPFPTGVLSPKELSRRTTGARPLRDGEDVAPPQAPDAGSWRVR